MARSLVQVCGADDDTNPCATTTVTVTINNTNPSVTIDLSGAINVNGSATIIAHAGAAVAFNGRVTDPGSDDLTLTWTWGDGTPASFRTSLVNPPNADPAVSPSIQPRDLPYPAVAHLRQRVHLRVEVHRDRRRQGRRPRPRST